MLIDISKTDYEKFICELDEINGHKIQILKFKEIFDHIVENSSEVISRIQKPSN